MYTKTERFVDENRSTLTYGVGGLAVLILAVIGYQSFVVGPAEAAAETDAWRAENYFEMDSMSLAALGDGYAAGLEEVMADHEGTAAANVPRTAWAFTTAMPVISKAPSPHSKK